MNTNPYFGVANDYIADLLPKMMDDMFKITVDPIYPPRQVEERENDFELDDIPSTIFKQLFAGLIDKQTSAKLSVDNGFTFLIGESCFETNLIFLVNDFQNPQVQSDLIFNKDRLDKFECLITCYL